MGYSWAAYGDFTLSPVASAKLRKALKPRVTTSKSFREDASFDDWVYSPTGLRYTSVFPEPYGEKREMLAGLVAKIADAGGEGVLTAVGFEDGGPDAGETWTLRAGKIAKKKIGSAAAAKKSRSHDAYAGIVAKWHEAFPEVIATPDEKPMSRWASRAVELLSSFSPERVFETVASSKVIVRATKKKRVSLSAYAKTPARLMALFREGDAKLDEQNDGAWRGVGLFTYLQMLDGSASVTFAEEILAGPPDEEFTPIAWAVLARMGDDAQRERAVVKAFAPSAAPQIHLIYGLTYTPNGGPRWLERLFCRWCDTEEAHPELAAPMFMAIQQKGAAFTDRAELASLLRGMSGTRPPNFPCMVFDRYALPHLPPLGVAPKTLLALQRGAVSAAQVLELRAALGIV